MESTQLRVVGGRDALKVAIPQFDAPKMLPVTTRVRRIVLTSAFYQNILAGHECFLIRPIMNIQGELRPLPTRARAQGGDGGLLWAFFPRSINADNHQLRSCPYGDPGDHLLITTPDAKDLPLTVTVLESYPHRVLGTTDKFLDNLTPSYWARLGDVQSFYDHWQRTFGRVFKLTQEPWAWVIRFEPPPKPAAAEAEPEPAQKPAGLFGRWRRRRKEKQTEEAAAAPAVAAATAETTSALPVPVTPNLTDAEKAHRHLLAAQRNALACLENAIKAKREGRTEEGWRMMNVAYRILNRAAEGMN